MGPKWAQNGQKWSIFTTFWTEHFFTNTKYRVSKVNPSEKFSKMTKVDKKKCPKREKKYNFLQNWVFCRFFAFFHILAY